MILNIKKTVLILLTFGLGLIFPSLSLSQNTSDSQYSPVVILDHPQSMAELLGKFEGKLIYIDLMASWCKPCIVELKESKKHESYFKKNDIIKLFISIDNKEDIEKAISMIQKDSLTGFFVSYHSREDTNKNSTFSQDIGTLFLRDENGDFDLSIPKYAIVNRMGELVETRAERPSNFESLKKQLEKYLGNE